MGTQKIMLDTNILNYLETDHEYLNKVVRAKVDGKIEPIITHIQEDELRVNRDAKKRLIIESIKPKKIATYGIITDISRSDYCRSGGGYSKLTGNKEMRKLKKWRDVLIGSTALNDVDVFVTNDNDFKERLKRIDSKLIVKDYLEFKAWLDTL